LAEFASMLETNSAKRPARLRVAVTTEIAGSSISRAP
jgi:hypothetical protein